MKVSSYVLGSLSSQLGRVVDSSDRLDCLGIELNCDSVEGMEIVLGLEERYDCELYDDELDSVQTIGELIQLVQMKL